MDGNAAAAPTPSDAGQAQPASGQTTDQIVLTKADYEKLNRQAQQGLGAQAIFEAARQAGRTNVQDIIAALKPTTAPSQTAPAPASPAGTGAISFEDEPRADVEAMIQAEFMVRDHKAAVDAQEKEIERLALEAVGASASEFEREAAVALLRQQAEQKAEMYPPGHPLRTRALAPVPKKTLEELAAAIKAKRGTKGAAMAAAAKAPAPGVPSILGAPGTAGAPVNGSADRPVLFSKLSRAEQEAWLASRKGAR